MKTLTTLAVLFGGTFTSHANAMIPIIAASDFSTIGAKGLGIVFLAAYMIAAVAGVGAVVGFMMGKKEAALIAIIGAALLAALPSILKALFSAGGLQTVDPSF